MAPALITSTCPNRTPAGGNGTKPKVQLQDGDGSKKRRSAFSRGGMLRMTNLNDSLAASAALIIAPIGHSATQRRGSAMLSTRTAPPQSSPLNRQKGTVLVATCVSPNAKMRSGLKSESM